MKWLKRGSQAGSDISPQVVRELSERFDIDMLLAAILARRGIKKASELLFFLEDDRRFLHNPFLFAAMEDAVDRIMLAADEEERVLVFGDRDADGITASALMIEALALVGIAATYRLPRDNEKYGLSPEAVDECAAQYVSLIITVDCGISNHAEVEYAREKGIDVIIIDHHILQAEEPPKALALINPKLPDSAYPFRDLSGCGTAYKVARALRFAATGLYKQNIALLNVRPLNDTYTLEAVRLSNLVETERLSESIVPGMLELDKTRLVPFLKDRQIFVWDGEAQSKLLRKAFGTSADVNFYDVRPDVVKTIPQADGLSLLRLAELSTLGRYGDKPLGELDTFVNVFTSFALRSSGCYKDENDNALQLAALSTIADVMPLRDENRILVRQGLRAVNTKPRKGFAELLARQNNIGKRLTATDASWQLIPIINAAGRMGQPELALKMFLSDDAAERGALADKLVELNRQRKEMGSQCWAAVYPAACKAADNSGGKYVIVGSRDIARGITGILAGRLAETFNAPAVAGTFLDDGSAVASIRSARGFKIKGLLEYCAELFSDYGGHDEAAGFSMPADRWPQFVQRAETYLSAFDVSDDEDCLEIDAELPHAYLAPALFDNIERLEPFGCDNPQLVFMARSVPIVSVDIIGKQEKSHLKFTLDFGEHRWPALWWGAADEQSGNFKQSVRMDLVFKAQKNYWNGQETAQLIVLDAKPV